ncbi:hypothetical protein A2U01_0089804 [Trifolium medium]|uniref:Uncharacterized protein n=1 Tax=Trifolium medium TaxID=97028 RepID=A0A392U4W1_9FABA|nr:hypothetical protein [Trifolium medium]
MKLITNKWKKAKRDPPLPPRPPSSFFCFM